MTAHIIVLRLASTCGHAASTCGHAANTCEFDLKLTTLFGVGFRRCRVAFAAAIAALGFTFRFAFGRIAFGRIAFAFGFSVAVFRFTTRFAFLALFFAIFGGLLGAQISEIKAAAFENDRAAAETLFWFGTDNFHTAAGANPLPARCQIYVCIQDTNIRKSARLSSPRVFVTQTFKL